MGHKNAQVDRDVYTANLIDPVAVTEFLEMVRGAQGPIGGLVHLLPLGEGTQLQEMEFEHWQTHHRLGTKSLFYLLKAATQDLKAATQAGAAYIVAATSMGGAFGSDNTGQRLFFPGQAGIAGLVKTLALEWPNAQCKVVDLDPGAPIVTLADCVIREIVAADRQVEVGYQDTRRLILQPRLTPLDRGGPPRLLLDADSVVLVTGGARGITAEIACELAARYQPTLLIIGRSPLPEQQESLRTAQLTSPQEIKHTLIVSMREAGRPVTPSQVEMAYARLCQDREIRSNLAAMEQAGGSVHYYQMDVRDAEAFGNLIRELYQSYGRIDGVIHGAGIIEDKLLEDKTADAFDRVFDTKVHGAYALMRHLRPDSLKFLVFFSSVAGRFGNLGQSDYAAANEVLNKLARYLDDRWPGRVMALNWGPWAGKGMVSEAIARQFVERGVELISSNAGRQIFDAELRHGQKGEAEVILGCGPWTAAATSAAEVEMPVPIISALPIRMGDSIECVHELDLARDVYLQDHRLDGKPVLPLAMAVELMAEIALKGWPGWEVVGLRGFQMLKGIIVSNGVQPIRIMAKPQTQIMDEYGEWPIDVEIREKGMERPAYKGTVLLGRRLSPPPGYALLSPQDFGAWAMDTADTYRRLLFHGPRFQCITEFLGVGLPGGLATVRPSKPSSCLTHPLSEAWVIDPIVLDCGLQLVLVWAQEVRGMGALPARFRSLRRFARLNTVEGLQCYVQVDPGTPEHTIMVDIYFVAPNAQVALAVEGLEASCSRALNRLVKGRNVS
jgi:NAD(P)-dependent dehydrogenase (short-subunit alcohol dehydrogenase family)